MSRAASAVDLVAAARAAGVTEQRLLKPISSTPRAGYVPGGDLKIACRDQPIPIWHGQVTTQPSLSARMIESLRLADADRVLGIGTGLGYQTALLARLASSVVRPAAPAGAHPGQIRPAVRALRVPVPVLTGLRLSLGLPARSVRAAPAPGMA